jgi:hypothetical protein
VLPLLLTLVPTLVGLPPAGPVLPQTAPQGEEAGPAPQASQVLQPGVIPAGTSTEAEALWRSLIASTREPGRELGPITAFDLSFDQRLRSGAQRNEFAALVRYLAPNHLRFRLESGREQMRGPSGDWLIDGDQVVALRGRAHAEDRRQMDDWLAVAANFVSLSDPASLRISRLVVAEKGPDDMPAHLRATAARLRWITLDSPDFRLFLKVPAATGHSMFRAHLGLDPDDLSLSLALLLDFHAEKKRTARVLLIQILDQRPLDGYVIPRLLHMYQYVGNGEGAFESRPSMELFVVDGSLSPALTPEDFLPR